MKRQRRNVAVLVLGAFFLATLAAQPPLRASYKDAKTGYAVPDQSLTPGAVDPEIVADTSGATRYVGDEKKGEMVEVNICAKDFRTGPLRKATKDEAVKRRVCEAYGAASGCPGAEWELDDAVPVEAGGENTEANLWPQPIKEARVKDHKVEDVLPKLICAGKLSLHEVQSCLLAGDWAACGRKWGLLP